MKLVQKSSPSKSLADFDLDDETIAKILKHAHSERMRVSAFAPSNARGSIFYITFVAGIREHLVMNASGWEKRNHNGLEVVENAEKGIRIAYVTAKGTEGDAMTSSPRGPMSAAAAEGNQLRLNLPANTFEPTGTKKLHRSARVPTFETWFIAVELVGKVYLTALALPTDADGGRFTHWEQKIPIANVLLDSEPKDDALVAAPAETTAPPKAKRKKKPSDDSESSEATG